MMESLLVQKFCQHHQSSGATRPRGKPQRHQTKKGKACFQTHAGKQIAAGYCKSHAHQRPLKNF